MRAFLRACLGVGLLGLGMPLRAQIKGSAHDFSVVGWAKGEICLPCHTPHDALLASDVLWNRSESTATFTLYKPTYQLGLRSKMCLSCHDGVTAMDNFGRRTLGTTVMTGSHVIGTDLTDDHPVGVTYPPNDPNYRDITGTPLRLYSGKVECATCHDPHGAGGSSFLRMSNAASALCLACHVK